jgi:hypothetical protein
VGQGLGTYVWPVNVTVPLGTPIATPTTTSPNLGDIWIDSIEILIPRGHNGLTGIGIANAGTQLLPYSQTAAYLVGDGDRLTFDFGVEVANGLTIQTYNTDIFAHTFYLRIVGRPIILQNPATIPQAIEVVPIS